MEKPFPKGVRFECFTNFAEFVDMTHKFKNNYNLLLAYVCEGNSDLSTFRKLMTALKKFIQPCF